MASVGGGVFGHRNLIWNFAQRDLRARFKGTALGWLWSLAVPLATLGIYTIVFSVIFRGAPPDFGSGRPGNFTVWLLAGLTAWSMFATSVNTAVPTLLSTGVLLKKIYFPSYAPVVGSVLAVMIQSGIEFGMLLLVLVILGNVGWTWLLVLPWFALFAVFIVSVSHVAAVLNVYFRDLAHIINVAIQLLFYLCPIIYVITFIPVQWHGVPVRAIISANPLTQFIQVFRETVYGLNPAPLREWAYCVLWAGLALSLAGWVQKRRGRDIGEEL